MIVRAIPFGNDTDTTAAITGGLAGIRWGVSSERVAFLASHDPLFELGIIAHRGERVASRAEGSL